MSQLNVSPPNLPLAEPEYNRQYFDKLNNTLRLFFNQLSNTGPLGATSLNFDLNFLPTQLDFNKLRLGDVYRDTVDDARDGSQMLRIKTSANVAILAGVSSSAAVGSVRASKSVALTGVSSSGAVGTVTP
jgi:hypothetical protein